MAKSAHIYHLLLLFAILASCSHIDEDERLVYVPPVDANRAVLIEDFTGQDCSNCPTAAAEIEKIKEQYGSDKVISVAIHGGQLARYSTARVVGLRTELGDEYVNHWGVANTLPKGYVSRTSEPCNPDKWGALVRDVISQEPRLQLTATVAYDESSRQLHADIQALGLDDVKGNLQLWLTESGIVTLQSMPDGTRNGSYVHNHVLRAAVNGAWGTPFEVSTGAYARVAFDYILDDGWNPGNMALVAFVYDNSGVLQVVEVGVLSQPIESEFQNNQ